MKTRIFILSLSIILSACSPSVDGWEVISAENVCANRGGIDNFSTVGGVYITCRDGYRTVPKRSNNE